MNENCSKVSTVPALPETRYFRWASVLAVLGPGLVVCGMPARAGVPFLVRGGLARSG